MIIEKTHLLLLFLVSQYVFDANACVFVWFLLHGSLILANAVCKKKASIILHIVVVFFIELFLYEFALWDMLSSRKGVDVKIMQVHEILLFPVYSHINEALKHKLCLKN